jgi:hypothetical protein
MYRGNSSRIFPIIIVLIVIAISVAALVSAGKAIFGGDSSTTQKDAGQQALLNTDVGNSVRMTVRGPITADEDFHSYTVTVSAGSRSLTTYTGYLDQQLDTNQLGNNDKAFEQFVYALNYANFMKDAALSGDKNDIRGICASGVVYQFDVLQSDGSSVKQLWTSTCKGSPGSFRGSVSQISSLFLLQIPDNAQLLKAIDL